MDLGYVDPRLGGGRQCEQYNLGCRRTAHYNYGSRGSAARDPRAADQRSRTVMTGVSGEFAIPRLDSHAEYDEN